MNVRALMLASVFGALLGSLAGCGKVPTVDEIKDSVSSGVEKAKETVGAGAETAKGAVQEATGQAGSIDLNAGGNSVKTSLCQATLTVISAGQPKVLQFSTYRDAASETFPSAYLRAEVTVDNIPALAGQTITGVLFIQATPESAVWHSIEGQPVELKISEASATRIVAKVSGKLTETNDDKVFDISGDIVGAIK